MRQSHVSIPPGVITENKLLLYIDNYQDYGHGWGGAGLVDQFPGSVARLAWRSGGMLGKELDIL